MSDLLSPVLAAILARLQADAGVMAQVGTPARVFAYPPTGATFPYIVLTLSDTRDAGAKSLTAQSAVLLVAVHHRDRTGGEGRRVLAAVRDSLHDATLSTVARCQEEFAGGTGPEDAPRALARYRLIIAA